MLLGRQGAGRSGVVEQRAYMPSICKYVNSEAVRCYMGYFETQIYFFCHGGNVLSNHDDDNDDVLWVDPDPKCVNCPPPHRGSFENIFATTSAAADALLVPLGNQQDTKFLEHFLNHTFLTCEC